MLPLDGRDLRILAILQKEGRISRAALADRVALSPTACLDRVRRLERAGVILGYGARLSASAFGPSMAVFVQVELASHRASDFSGFESRVAALDEVVACWAVGGGFDYLLQVAAPDIDAYQRLIDRLLELDLGIRRYFTYVVTKTVKAALWPSVPRMPPGPAA